MGGHRYYPVFLDIEGALCVVVGGGEVAARKAAGLVASGARVRAVAARFSEKFERLTEVERVEADFAPSCLEGARVVIAATDDAALNAEVSRAARVVGALVNVVDTPRQGDFIVPAVVLRGDLTLAVSTGGACPALAARIRRDLERAYPPLYGEFVDLLREVRREVLGAVPEAARRRVILERLAGPEFLAALAAEGARSVRRRMRRFIAEEAGRSPEDAPADTGVAGT